MKRVKPGYIILALLAMFFIYKYYFDDSKIREAYTKEVNIVLTDLKHEDSFALQSKLSPNLTHYISIDDLQNYIEHIKLGSRYKFELKDYEKEDNNLTIYGYIIKKDKKEPIKIEFNDTNNSFAINSLEIGKAKLSAKKYSFPIAFYKKDANNSVNLQSQN